MHNSQLVYGEGTGTAGAPNIQSRQNMLISRDSAWNRTEESMKRVLSIIILSIFLTTGLSISFERISPGASIVPTAEAQTRTRRRRRGRSFWQKHRDKLTVAAGAGTGAAIGAGVGSKKAAGIGAGVGAGSAALYTYKLRKRHRRARRY